MTGNRFTSWLEFEIEAEFVVNVEYKYTLEKHAVYNSISTPEWHQTNGSTEFDNSLPLRKVLFFPRLSLINTYEA